MKVPCDVIFDLIPLYQEDLCTEMTKKFVEEHLKECPQCQRLLENSQKNIFNVKQVKLTQFDEKSVVVLKGMKRKMNRKSIFIAILSTITTFLLILGIARIYFGQGVPMEVERISALTQEQIGTNPANWPEPSHEEFWIDEMDDGSILLEFNQFFTGANVLRRTREIEGVEKDVIYLNITQTQWDLFWNNLWVESGANGYFVVDKESFRWDGVSGKMNLRTFDGQSSENEIVAIYYLDVNFSRLNRMDNAQFNAATENAFLLWER